MPGEELLYVRRGRRKSRLGLGPPWQHADEFVASRIRSAIERRELKPGDRLPSEADLGEALHVSRDPVGRGLGILKAEGLLVSRQGSGWFVT